MISTEVKEVNNADSFPILAVKATREASDEVRMNLLPELAEQLVLRGLTLPQLMQINRVYINKGGAVLTFGESFSEEENSNVDFEERINSFNNDTNPDTLIRSIRVHAVGSFQHPSHTYLERFGTELLGQLGEFVGSAERFDDRDIRRVVYKYHMLFSLLHLPRDGSGRFIGDVDSLIQLAVGQKLSQSGREFSPQFLSINGYRMGSGENWSIIEEQNFRKALLEDFIDANREKFSRGGLTGRQTDRFYFDYRESHKQMGELCELLGEDDSLMSEYDCFWERFLEDEVGRVNRLDGRSFLDLHSSYVTDFTEFRKYSQTYYYSRAFGDSLGLLDTVVGMYRGKEIPALGELMSSERVIGGRLLEIPTVDKLLRVIWYSVQGSNPDIARNVAKQNPKFAQRMKKVGRIIQRTRWWEGMFLDPEDVMLYDEMMAY